MTRTRESRWKRLKPVVARAVRESSLARVGRELGLSKTRMHALLHDDGAVPSDAALERMEQWAKESPEERAARAAPRSRNVPHETPGRNGTGEPDVRAALDYVASKGLDGWQSERMIAEIAALYRAAAMEWEGRAAARRAEQAVLAEQGARSREQIMPGVTPAEIQELLRAGRALSTALRQQAEGTARKRPPRRTGTE